MNILQCLGINLRTEQRVRKNLGESKSTAAQKPLPDRSDLKRTPEIVAKCQRSQRINLVHCLRHGSVWVFYQAGCAWRHSVFLLQDKKGPVSIIGHKEQGESKAFEITQESRPTEHTLVFLKWEKFCLDLMVNSKRNRWLALSLYDVPMLLKTKHLFCVMVFGVVTSDVNFMPIFIFANGLTPNTGLLKMPEGKSAARDLRGWLPENPTFCNSSQQHAIQAGEPSLGSKKISVTP